MQPGQPGGQVRRHDDGIRAFGDLDQAAIEIEKQGGIIGQLRCGHSGMIH